MENRPNDDWPQGTPVQGGLKDALLRVRALLVCELGVPQVEIDRQHVPPELQVLVPLVTQFGIGDDGSRERAIELMPKEFIAQVAQLVRQHEDAVSLWVEEGEFGEEKSAFVALMQGFLYRDREPYGGAPNPTTVKLIQLELERLLDVPPS